VRHALEVDPRNGHYYRETWVRSCKLARSRCGRGVPGRSRLTAQSRPGPAIPPAGTDRPAQRRCRALFAAGTVTDLSGRVVCRG
jgi:hypothetical protein